MSDTTQSPDLSALTADYDLVGELDTVDGPRTYIGRRKSGAGKRRDDQAGVLISLVTTPQGDEGNALTLLAADTQVLARLTHRRLIPVLEGRWIADDVYAVVTQRVTDPSLGQRLSAGETFTNPRIAAILREVNGLLEWAREQKIVHRSVTPERVFLEPKTDRVRVSFGIAPIRRIRHSDADDDARTIARLAVAMLTGNADVRAGDESLADRRPDLPVRLVDATTALLDEKTPGTPADVAAYLALIGMADPLFEGEAERERIRAEILEEQRLEREKLAGERAAFEQEMAAKHADFEREMAMEREKLAAERAELERAATAERETLRSALAAERAQMVAKREELERTVAEQRASMEQAAAEDRRRIELLRAEIQRAGEVEVEKKRQAALEEIEDQDTPLDDPALATPLFAAPMLAPLDELTFDDESPVMRDEPIVFAPPTPEPIDEPVATNGDVPVLGGIDGEKADGSRRRRRTLIGVAAGLVVIAAGGAAIAIATNRSGSTPAAPASRPPVVSRPIAVAAPPSIVPLPAPATIVDSAAGRLAPATDSIARARATQTASGAAAGTAATTPAGTTPASATASSSSGATDPAAVAAAAAARRARAAARDSAARRAAAARESTTRNASTQRRATSLSDSLFNFRDPVATPRRDSVARPDTTNP